MSRFAIQSNPRAFLLDEHNFRLFGVGAVKVKSKFSILTFNIFRFCNFAACTRNLFSEEIMTP